MSTLNNPQPNATVAPAEQPVVLEPEAVVEQLRALRQGIPEFVQLPIPDARSLQTVARAGPEFVQAAMSAIGTSAGVQSILGTTPAELQQDTELAARWALVEHELRAMLDGVAAANLLRRHRIGLVALQTYQITRQLVRKKENSALLPYVAIMRMHNKYGRKRPSATPPSPPPPTQ